jgi:hypothetical protein
MHELRILHVQAKKDHTVTGVTLCQRKRKQHCLNTNKIIAVFHFLTLRDLYIYIYITINCDYLVKQFLPHVKLSQIPTAHVKLMGK